jgi:hypothetical protein
MRSRHFHGWPAILCIALASCGATGFEKPSIVKGVRVLAVQKEPAYPHPGETVKLTMLYWDGKASSGAARPIQTVWFGGDPSGWNCINPPGDLYYNCFASGGVGQAPEGDAGAGEAAPMGDAGVADAAAQDAASGDGGFALPPAIAGHASTHRAVIPPANVILKPIPPDRGPPYGLEYVFFGVCAGRIDYVPPTESPNTLPIGCYGSHGELLGPDDFVPGYTSLYVYADRRNANPIVGNLNFNGAPIGSMTGPVAPAPTVPHCTASDSIDCPAYPIKAEIDPASAEEDPATVKLDGEPIQEQIWVAYFATAGEFKDELRLVNDAQDGWNEDHGTVWHLPTTPGPVHLWAVVHDNRGGVAWAEGAVIVE